MPASVQMRPGKSSPGVGKEFTQKYSAILAYRRLDVHYRSGGFLFDTSMNGLLLGFGIRFE
jgi:hypothetical protein